VRARLEDRFLEDAERALREEGLDGWLLYDVEGRNGVATEALGLPEGTSRRLFVLIRPGRPPAALAHRIERQKLEAWQGELREYVGWQEMETALESLLEGVDRVAMEVSPGDAVPFVDQVPAGVVELVEELGPRVVTSADLISRTCARWGDEGLRLHRRAAEELAGIARDAWEGAREAADAGDPLSERALADVILERARAAGLTEADTIVAGGPNSALPHYEPPAEGSRLLEAGDVLLVDLWARVADEPRAVFADQTWMGVLGPVLPEGFGDAWDAVREARDGAVEAVREGAAAGELPTGAEVDARAREILGAHGFGDAEILHRTGHGIDRALHGFGPNLDAVETRDERRLVPGVGFSVEPGVYLEGRWGIRSEINVHVGPDGPEVTPGEIQREPWRDDG
jgi:Xaa-Pro aminopeptidase